MSTDNVGRRKHIKKRFQKKNPRAKLEWLGGRLYDVTWPNRAPLEVADAPHVPKARRTAMGIDAARRDPITRTPRNRYGGSATSGSSPSGGGYGSGGYGDGGYDASSAWPWMR